MKHVPSLARVPTALPGALAGAALLALLGGQVWGPAPAAWLMLPWLANCLWADRLRKALDLASLAGGWLAALFVQLVVSSVIALAGLPLQLYTALLFAVAGVGLFRRARGPLDDDGRERRHLALLVAATACLIAAWGTSVWEATARIEHGEELRIWQDWFHHGALIDMLAASATQGLHDLRSIALPLQPYHYLSYGLAAWVSAVSGSGGLQLALTLWWPMGMLMLVLAGSEWVARLRPDRPWLPLVLPLTLFLPDASLLGSGHPFLGWHWLQIISPGALFGSAAMLALSSWAWRKAEKSGPGAAVQTLTLLALLCVAMFFKAQIVLLGGPVLMIWWAAHRPPGAAARRTWLAATLLLGLVVLLGPTLPGLPTLHLGGGGWREYWPALLRLRSDGWLSGFDNRWLAPVVILVGTLGWMLFGVAGWFRAPSPARMWLLLVLAGYLLFALGLDLNTTGGAGTPEELMHRPLVWVLPMWWLTAASYLRLPHPADGAAAGIIGTAAVLAALLAGVAAGLHWGATIQAGPPAIAGGAALAAGQVESAAYVAAHRHEGDVCQTERNDTTLQWVALSRCPPYWVDFFNLLPRASARVKAHAEEWQKINKLPLGSRLVELGRIGVRWYILGPVADGFTGAVRSAGAKDIEPSLRTADGYLVYEISPRAEARGP